MCFPLSTPNLQHGGFLICFAECLKVAATAVGILFMCKAKREGRMLLAISDYFQEVPQLIFA